MRDPNASSKQYLPPEYLWQTRRPNTLKNLLDQQPEAGPEERPKPRKQAEEPCSPTFRPMPYARRSAAQPRLLESAQRTTKTVIQGG